MESDWEFFISSYEQFLNNDEELRRRMYLKDAFETRDVFFGGRPCLPGSGPYPRASIAFDPSNWASAKGYARSRLPNREIVELIVENAFHITIDFIDDRFSVRKGRAENPVLSCRFPLSIFRDLVLGKHKVVWALCMDPVKVTIYEEDVSLSDWTTILEILVSALDLAEMNPDMWKFWAQMNIA